MVISKLEDRSVEITQSYVYREKKIEENEKNLEMCETIVVCGPTYMLFES